MRGLGWILLGLLVAAPAWADLWVENCTPASVDCAAAGDPYDCCTAAGAGCPIATTTGTVGATSIGKNDLSCWTWDNLDGTATSPVFVVSAGSVLVCFDPDIRGAPAAATARLTVYYCMAGAQGQAANPEFSCLATGALDGTEGDEATQNACRRFGPGAYYLEATAACVATDVCRATVKGEEDVQ